MTRAHDLLGVEPGASLDELKEGYREMVKVWHPDRFADDPKLQKKAQEKLQQINRAFEELTKQAAAPPSAARTVPAYVPSEPLSNRSSSGPWPVLLLLVIFVAPLVYVSAPFLQRRVDPKALSEVPDRPVYESGMRRYALTDPNNDETYIIEGPRPPLDWEFRALLEAYVGQNPRVRQSVGNFTITQTARPDEKGLIIVPYPASG